MASNFVPAGKDRTVLRVNNGLEDIKIQVELTDAELYDLVMEGMSILKNRNWAQRNRLQEAEDNITPKKA